MAPDQRRQIAVHEAGHAVAQHFLLPDRRIVHLTIVARAQSLGFMLPLDQVERYAYPLRRIVAGIMVGMAGHVATRVVFGEEWTGAYGDFQQVRGFEKTASNRTPRQPPSGSAFVPCRS